MLQIVIFTETIIFLVGISYVKIIFKIYITLKNLNLTSTKY